MNMKHPLDGPIGSNADLDNMMRNWTPCRRCAVPHRPIDLVYGLCLDCDDLPEIDEAEEIWGTDGSPKLASTP